MERDTFTTADGRPVPAVTADEMRAVDRVAVEEFGLGLLVMMENAGRNLARHVRGAGDGPVTVLAGNGGNGGGGLCCARHLANRDVDVSVVLDRDPADLSGAARTQFETLDPDESSVVSLDVPSGLNATTGEREGVAVDPDGVVTLALPKTGLDGLDCDVVLADIAIPAGVFESLDVPYTSPFDEEYRVALLS